jgi:spore maturation protein CgeB
MTAGLRVIVLGLSITSSWGNGHATNYRGLVRALSARGHDVLFLERDVPWYAAHRDLSRPPYGRTELYDSPEHLFSRFGREIAGADLVVVGSYVPDGLSVGRFVTTVAGGITAFYDIDTPVTLSAVGRGDCEYLSAELIPEFDLYLSFTGGPTLSRLAEELGAREVRAFHCFVDPEAYAPADVPRRWDLGYLGTYSEDRQPALEALLLDPARRRPELSFVVAGPQYPASIEWPANVARVEHVAPRDHPAFYSAQRFTLNLTRADMLVAGWSPSVRLFEAAACATPVLSDRWEGLEHFFTPGEEILAAVCTDDVLSVLDDVAEDARADLARRARARVLKEHTAAQRARYLERLTLELLQTRKRP